MRHLLPHYANKYGLENVECTDSQLKAYRNGRLSVLIEKDGAGNLQDRSEEFGLPDRHDLAPIPKDGRLYKMKDGKLAKDELHDERKPKREALLKDGRLPSEAELEQDAKKAKA